MVYWCHNDGRYQYMDEQEKDTAGFELAEIERLIKDFKEKFEARTTDADNFMNISEMELMWGELQDKTNNIYSDMVRKMMSEVDESDLIRKKNDNSSAKG
jgi:pyruvate formate-lyase activating enzyme-like uncharacterized protein